MSQPDVRRRVREHLEAAGLTADIMAGHLARLMGVRRMGMDKFGDVHDLGDDGTTQVKAAELIYKLRDELPNPRLDIDHKVSGAVVVLGSEASLADPFADAIEGEARELP